MTTHADYFYGTRTVEGLSPREFTTATTTNGLPISLSKGISYKMSLVVYSRTNGAIEIEALEVAEDEAFTTGVTTFSATSYPEQVLKNDRRSSVDAFTQTRLADVGTRVIHFRGLGVNGQAFIRAKVKTTGTVALSAYITVDKLENEAPISPVQS